MYVVFIHCWNLDGYRKCHYIFSKRYGIEMMSPPHGGLCNSIVLEMPRDDFDKYYHKDTEFTKLIDLQKEVIREED